MIGFYVDALHQKVFAALRSGSLALSVNIQAMQWM